MAVTINSFLTGFPEFSSTDANTIIQLIAQAEIEACFDNLGSIELTDLAISLYVAHFLQLQERSNSEYSQGGQIVKSLKSKHDQITWQEGSGDPFDYMNTLYGARLQRLLDANNPGLDIDWCCNSTPSFYYY